MKSKWIKISLFFFLIIAIIGTLLRGLFFINIPLDFQNIVHAHSHTAFQGWIYTAQFLLLTKLFLRDEQIKKGRYALQFKVTIVVILGVLVSFALQGYGLFSILFSTLFQVLNFIFIYRFLKDIRSLASSVGIKFVKTGLWLGVLSNFLPFAIGFLTAKGLKGTELFYSCLYSFLHLQYNGWFLFVGIGLLLKILEKKLTYNKDTHRFYELFAITVLPAITLSFLGMSFAKYILIPAYISAFLQYLGVFYLVRFFYQNRSELNLKHQLFFTIFLASFLLKIVLQSLSVFPIFKELAFENKFIILAYLHLNFIGVLSFLILAVIAKLKWLLSNFLNKIGSFFLIIGFLLTELFLVLGGLGIFYSMIGIFIASAFIALGVLILLV
ncbi:MAG: hypothetical protein KGV44_03715 [Flavobacteriaceae bacterium]|nr:hypothetical protein [Flavobacteriaceae bacterium]